MDPIHPFPARMAPDLAREALRALPAGSRVLDPMCGSGTVVRLGVEAGHRCVGRDLDPLAVLLTRAWTTRAAPYRLLHDSQQIIDRAVANERAARFMRWPDQETAEFVRFWFGLKQRRQLYSLAQAILRSRFRTRDLLQVAFSRLIITKDRGASLARDVSHSRPHRVMVENDFDVYAGFGRAARLIARRLHPELLRGEAETVQGDAREWSRDHGGLFDAVITSPPYLNAIDYLRGHRLTLVWFGHSVTALGVVRSTATGTERGAYDAPIDVTPFIVNTDRDLPDRYVGWVRRYATDVDKTLAAMKRVVRRGGRIVIVVGNSLIRGAAVHNAGIIEACGSARGLRLVDSQVRLIPARRRYLPPPRDGTPFANRMRAESVLTFQRR